MLSAGFALVASLLSVILLPETLPDHVRAQEGARRAEKQRGTRGRDTQRTSLVTLVLLFATLLLIDLGTVFIYPFSLPQYPFFFANALHYDTAQYGLIVSAYGLALAVFPLILGRLIDAFPKKLLVVLGCLFGAALNLAMLLLAPYLLLITAAVITGVGSALLMPAMGTIYLNASSDENRSQLMGIRSTAISLALLLAPLAQAIAGHWMTPQITFAIATGLSLVVTLFALIALKEPRPHTPAGESTLQAS